jgi:protein involved in polysaccharide export with SLBB domain
MENMSMIIKRFIWLVVAATAMAVSLAAQAADNAAPAETTPAPESVNAAYSIKQGDLLQLSVWKGPDLAREEVVVAP